MPLLAVPRHPCNLLLAGIALFALVAALLLAAPSAGPASAQAEAEAESEVQPAPVYEVWTVDQSNAADGGDHLYVYSSDDWLNPEAHALGEPAAFVGDGAGVRPHLLLFNNAQTHALLANVGTGHVYVIRAEDRQIVASIDIGEQAHGAMASPDDRWILGANQNGKKLARVYADFANEVFIHDPETDLDLAALESEATPDNAPICPVMYVGANKAYVTLRGGGLFVVDMLSTPMQVLRTYSREEVAPAGCGGIEHNGRVYVNSGSLQESWLYVFDAETDDLLHTFDMSIYGTDAHGMAIVGDRYLWMAHRALGDNIVVVDTETLEVVNVLDDVGAAPDLLDVSPDGQYVFVTLRGPKALTGGAGAIGETPGVTVMAVTEDGANGHLAAFFPIGLQAPESTADPHAIAVRLKHVPPAPQR